MESFLHFTITKYLQFYRCLLAVQNCRKITTQDYEKSATFKNVMQFKTAKKLPVSITKNLQIF